MKKVLLPLFVCLLLVSTAFGAWTYQGQLGRNIHMPHGCVVDQEGKVWIANYHVSDTLYTTEGDTLRINAIQVWAPTGDGYEEASFSPICILTNDDDINDTLDYTSKPYSFRGASILPTGEILVMNKFIWKLDPSTGKAIERFEPAGNASLTNPGVDDNGYIYFGHVVGSAGPVYIVDGSDFSAGKYADAIASPTWGYSRSMLVSPDGTDLYIGTLGQGVLNYHSDLGPDGEYTFVDTLAGTENKSVNGGMAWDRDGKMWIGDRSNGSLKKILILDPDNDFAVLEAFKDTLIYPAPADTLSQGSGFGFSLTGDTVYVVDYDGNTCKIFTKGESGVWEHTETIAEGYALNQNYPNPFNPTTMIPFEIKESGFVQVVVYDMLGREVANLVNEKLNAGKHTISFDGSSLAAGTYVYRLKANGVVKTRKMSLVK